MPTVKEVLVSTAIAIGVIIGTSVVAWGVAIPVAIYRDHQYFVHDASVLRDSNSKLKTAYTDGYQKGKSEQLEIDAKPVVPEAADSLRRRTTKLASDINEYLSDWEMHRPAPGSNAPEATIEQKTQSIAFMNFETERLNTCVKRFGPTWTEIIQQLNGRGIPTHVQFIDLEWAFSDKNRPFPLCANRQQTEFLRELAYRLDPAGNPIHF